MSNNVSLHAAQRAILETLRHTTTARYSDMMRAADMESDTFKFHVRALVYDGAIEKLPDGSYRLTTHGKEYANSLDDSRTPLRQPKISLLLVVHSSDGKVLLHRRKRQPFYDYIGLPSGPARWGEDFVVTAVAELKKQTGLEAEFQVVGMRRERDLDKNGAVREDKLFILLCATATGEPQAWHGGESMWYDETAIEGLDRIFTTTCSDLQWVCEKKTYEARDVVYEDKVY